MTLLKLLRMLEVRLLGDPPDPAWTQQTPVQRFHGYDPRLARRGVARAREKWARLRRANAK